MKKTFLLVFCLSVLVLSSCDDTPSHVHDWGEWETAKEATCTADGYKIRKCRTCGAEDSEKPAIKAKGHSYGDEKTIPASCEKDGKKYKVCSVCSYELVEETTLKLGHDWIEGEITREATCSEEGRRKYTCSRCDKMKEESIPVTDHDMETSGTLKSKATCSEPKVVVYKCRNCSYTEERSEGETDPDNHSGNTEWKTVSDVKYFTEGTEQLYCTKCNKYLSDTRTAYKDPTGFWVSENSDTLSFANGLVTYGSIGEEYGGNYIESGPYPYRIGTGEECRKNALCIMNGDECLAELEIVGETEDTITLKAHYDNEQEILLSAVFQRKTETPHTHSYTAPGWTYTLIKDEETGYVNAVLHSRKTTCNEHAEFNLVDPETEHVWENGKCKDCGSRRYYPFAVLTAFDDDSYEYDIYYANAVDGIVLPGENKLNYRFDDSDEVSFHGGDRYIPKEGEIICLTTIGYCDVPDDLKTVYRILSSHEHSFDTGEVTIEAECEKSGLKTFTCTDCGAVKSETIAPIGHDYHNEKEVAATCTEPGHEEYYYCSRCSYTTYKEIPALGHDFLHYDAKSPTCTEKGWKAYDECSRCSYTSDYTPLPELGHDLVAVESKPGSCTPGWYTYKKCSRCDYTTEKIEIPATGEHRFENYRCKDCAIWDKGPGGGYVFYDCDADNTASGGAGEDGLSSETCGWRFLEAAPQDVQINDDGQWAYVIRFGYYRTSDSSGNEAIGGTKSGIGDGKENTRLIVEKMGSGAYKSESGSDRTELYAAKVADDYISKGLDDWFLPSKDELSLMDNNLCKKDLGSFCDDYWSSTESTGTRAYFRDFEEPLLSGTEEKSVSKRVRPVRSFLKVKL